LSVASAAGSLRFIAGPCVLESYAEALATAQFLAEVASRRGVEITFKASFDKANRSSVRGYRGPGLTRGLEWLAAVRAETGLAVLTDVHAAEQCGPVAEVVDVLQVPAFLCRQTDLVQAAAATGRPVNYKRGQFLDPRRMGLVLEKARAAGPGPFSATERGTSFGHGDLVLDPRALVWLRSSGGAVWYDATHSLQQPGGEAETTRGLRDLVLPLARAAAAVGVDAIYAEVHPEPARALSDAETQLDFASFERLVVEACAVDAARRAASP
jgi:2-dehydro-3-deoxyphosphooctonate aldolase (KDO 8-P synthase)